MIDIAVKPPFPWEQLLNYLSTRCIPGFERIENACYYRQHRGSLLAVSYAKQQKTLRVSFDPPFNPDSQDEADIRHRVTRLFCPQLPTAAVYKHLALHLPLAKQYRGFRPPGCWDAFELCVRTIVGQQVSVAAAQTLMQRLVERCGAITPETVLSANLDKLGMPERRVQTLRRLAQAVVMGDIDLAWPWPQLDQALAGLAGIGPWTRGYLAIRLGRDADAFPETDIGLIRAAGADSAKELMQQAERWRPYRAYAAVCLWAR